MNIPLAFGEYIGRSNAVNAMLMTNMMVARDNEGGAAPYFLTATPGCETWVNFGQLGDGRGGFITNGTLLCVFRKWVYTINTTTKVAAHIYTLTTTAGPVKFYENPTQIMMIDGTAGYICTKGTYAFSAIADGDFPAATKSCTVKDGYGVAVSPDSGKIYVSAINNFSSWDALAFTTAEFEPDNLMGVAATPDSLIALGEKTLQVYYNSGNITFPFDPRPGANSQVGCSATNSIASGFNMVFWLDNYGAVRMLSGYSPQEISTSQIVSRIAQLTTISDATGYVYTQDGHLFYVLTFPSDKLTLVYDVTTGQWHRRASYPDDDRWRASWITQDNQLIIAGDYSNGKLYKLNTEVYEDNAERVRWYCTTQNVNSDMKMLAHDRLELHIETGYAAQSETPELWMQYSDDEGNTWSRERWRSMGEVGEFKKRIVWNALGQSRGRIYRFGGADAVKRNIVSAHLEVRNLGF